MKKSTLLLVAAVMASSSAFAQQKGFSAQRLLKLQPVKVLKAKKSLAAEEKANAPQAFTFGKVYNLKAAPAKADANSVFVPAKQDIYSWGGSAWGADPYLDQATTYNQDGTVKEQTLHGYSTQGTELWQKTSYTYNENGLPTLIVTSQSLDNKDFTDFQKETVVYDEKVPTVAVSDETTELSQTGEWTVTDGSKYDITRDSKGRVTKVVSSSFDTKAGDYAVDEQNVYTYKAGSDDLASVTLSSPYNGVLSELYKFTNLVFETNESNGQYIYDFVNWMEGDIKLKSADFVYDGSETGTLETTYSGNKADMDLNIPGYQALIRYTLTSGENGGYAFESGQYQPAEVSDANTKQYTKIEYQYDDHGNRTLVEQWLISPSQGVTDLLLVQGVKSTYTYNTENGGLQEYVTQKSQYEAGAAGYVSGDYKNVEKGVTTEYASYTPTAIEGVENAADAKVEGVYNVNGVKVGTSLDAQPKGLYIVKQGGKSYKVVK